MPKRGEGRRTKGALHVGGRHARIAQVCVSALLLRPSQPRRLVRAAAAEVISELSDMSASEGLGLANCQAVMSPKSSGALAAHVPRSSRLALSILLLGGGEQHGRASALGVEGCPSQG